MNSISIFFYVDYILSLHADTHHNPRSLRIDHSWPQYLFEGHLKTPSFKISKITKARGTRVNFDHRGLRERFSRTHDLD